MRNARSTSTRLLLATALCCSCDTSVGDVPQVPGHPDPPAPPGDTGTDARWAPYGVVVSAAVPPPPVSGGTLLVLRDGTLAVAADPDRDQVYFVDLARSKVAFRVKLLPGDEPGRLVEGEAGRVHVVLRGPGAVVSIDRDSGSIVDRRPVCPTPRGLALDARGDLLVACINGDVMRLGATGGDAVLAAHLDDDLRDLVARPGDGGFYATRFRAAEVLVLDENLSLLRRIALPAFHSPAVRGDQAFTPRVAWRAVLIPGTNDLAVVHQRAQATLIAPTVVPAYYTPAFAPGSAVTHATITVVTPGGALVPGPVLDEAVLPVDVALTPGGAGLAVADAGNVQPVGGSGPSVFEALTYEVRSRGPTLRAKVPSTLAIQAVAVAYTPGGSLLVQSREPAVLTNGRGERPIVLSAESRLDTGHLIFHSSTGYDIACASCHPEGGDDGHVWSFAEGLRRTPPLRGGIAHRAPYHWDGAETTLGLLAFDVFTGRMNGPQLGDAELGALGRWLEAIPALPPQRVLDPAAAERGRQVYHEGECASCHGEGAPRFANVATGGVFKAPSLRSVAWRLPLLHDGCAGKLVDRFTTCGGGHAHGRTKDMTVDQRDDLIAWLESL